ncbi:AAA family ATPase [Alsobacter sp. SYSU M60028]|uniref:AAA family ATPase n=1 Tax=Alsobacter ponti TaxID=2962936 RepID=A0ABT1LEJ7_9HYPH|nr:AAA family ATPase [Alsobacter ponti]
MLHSDAPLVVVEAAAGCGKTWTAAKFAKEMSARLTYERVLLLSHTHGACGEFHRRCVGPGLRIDVETCDSFALKVVGPYAAALGLPYPFDHLVGRPGLPFETIRAKAVDLVQRSPTVARLISARYPVIILDEHQDASLSQHQLVMTLMTVGGSRLRVFGDPMQALHSGSREDYVDWDTLWASCSDRWQLTEPKRWNEAPELGKWITAARTKLKAGGSIGLHDAPSEVRVRPETGLAGRKKLKNPRLAGEILHAFLDDGHGRAAVIAHMSDMVRALAQAASWRAGVNEGAVLEHLDRLLSEAEKEAGTAADVAAGFLTFASDIGSGFPKALRESLGSRVGAQLNLVRAGASQSPWLHALEPIYAEPSHRGLATAMERLIRNPPAGYRIRLRDHAAALRAIGWTDDPRGHLHALSRLRRQRSLPQLSTSTVHKAKGLEFRRVLVCPADAQQYPSGAYGARLFYVAISRATHQLTIVTDALSPMVHLQ